VIAAKAPCDVLIGVQGHKGKILTQHAGAPGIPQAAARR
jgi:hypothetical protein